MPNSLCLHGLRQVLARLFPMQGVVVVGAGRGQGLADFFAATSLLAIDGLAENLESLHRLLSTKTGGIAASAVITRQAGFGEFFVASSPAESGLIPPAELRGLWRNLDSREVREVETLDLPALLARLKLRDDRHWNWLVIDCLPALRVLEGATSLVDELEVLELRCIRDDAGVTRPEASLSTSMQWLEARGFRLIADEDEAHPGLCTAVFCRDARELSDRLVRLAREQARLDAAHVEQALVLAKVTTEQVAAEKLVADRQSQLEALHQEMAALTAVRDAFIKDNGVLVAERDALAREKAALVQACDEQAKLAAERAAQLASRAEAQSAAEKLAAERQSQLEVLKQEKAALAAERDATLRQYEVLRAECDSLRQSVAAEQERQVLLDEEMVKANAQLALIKDLLLRESGL